MIYYSTVFKSSCLTFIIDWIESLEPTIFCLKQTDIIAIKLMNAAESLSGKEREKVAEVKFGKFDLLLDANEGTLTPVRKDN